MQREGACSEGTLMRTDIARFTHAAVNDGKWFSRINLYTG